MSASTGCPRCGTVGTHWCMTRRFDADGERVRQECRDILVADRPDGGRARGGRAMTFSTSELVVYAAAAVLGWIVGGAISAWIF